MTVGLPHLIVLPLCLALMLCGCATTTPYAELSLANEEALCLRWFESVDAAVAEYGVDDPGAVRIGGFPELRVNRFLSSLRDSVSSDAVYAAWLEQLRQLDASAREAEVANLPDTVMQKLMSNRPPGESFAQAIRRCGKILVARSLDEPEHKHLLLEEAEVPDAYQAWKRYVGIYILAQYAAELGIERLHRELAESFRLPLEKLTMQGRLLRYYPPHNHFANAEDVAKLLVGAYRDSLAIPSFTSAQMQLLFETFAPVWEIDTRNDSDRIGTVSLDADGKPVIDTVQPTIYITHAFSRWHGKILLQLIYQIWLPEREKTGMFDLYGGPLDSVIWRVTLSPEGTPIAYDSIHACGCYYMLFPAPGYRALAPQDGAEPVLSPKTIAAIPAGYRLLLRLQSRTHYIQQVALTADTANQTAQTHNWQAIGHLRSLPLPDGLRRSLYDSDGIVAASERMERFFLWPFGVRSPGAMREWGTHAIAFIGRRQFDDAYLLEKVLGGQ